MKGDYGSHLKKGRLVRVQVTLRDREGRELEGRELDIAEAAGAEDNIEKDPRRTSRRRLTLYRRYR